MKTNRDLSLVNGIATAFLAYFFTIPFHEFLHFVTFYIYGDKVEYFSAGSVGPIHLHDYHDFPPFHRIMVAGGSASIINSIIGVLLFLILKKVKDMSPMLRLFLTQLMGGQLLEGFGYFLIGGLFATGDWGNVFSYFDDSPQTVIAMRIVLSVIGVISAMAILRLLTSITYSFIENPEDREERKRASLTINLTIGLTGIIIGTLADLRLPEVRNGHLPIWLFLLYKLMWTLYIVAFFYAWGGIMVKPSKAAKHRSNLPSEPHPFIWCLAIVLTLIDIIVFGPGVYLN